MSDEKEAIKLPIISTSNTKVNLKELWKTSPLILKASVIAVGSLILIWVASKALKVTTEFITQYKNCKAAIKQ